MKAIALLFFSLLSSNVYSQSFSGTVVDQKTGEALEYASIGVPGKNIGGISLRSGEFVIDISGVSKNDVIKVSYLGYETASVRMDTLVVEKRHTIKLLPKPQELRQVEIAVKSQTQKVGHEKVGRTFTGWGDFQSLRGRTRGLLIEGLECPVKAKAFYFRLNHNDWDSVAFRLNFLKVEDGKAGTSLLQENIFLTSALKHKWVRIDLDRYNVILCSKTIVTLEWVDAWGKTGVSSNMLTLSLSKNSGLTFHKEANEEFGELKFYEHAPAMYLELYGGE